MRAQRRGVTDHISGFIGRASRRFLSRFLPRIAAPLLLLIAVAFVSLYAPSAKAQDNPKMVIDEDCQAFDISANNEIVFAVPRLKRVKKLIIERDEIDVATGPGKGKRIVDPDKFMPVPPPQGYMVNALRWGPDGHHIAADLTLTEPPSDYHVHIKKKGEEDRSDDSDVFSVGGRKAIALFDSDGSEIKMAGSKDRFIENGTHAAWLADGKSVVYLSLGPPYSITRVRPDDGQSTVLFDGHTFDTVIFDPPRNRAFAVGENLSLRGRLTLVELNLLKETVTEIAPVDTYKSSLTLSQSGKKIGFFEDGDTIEVLDIANPSKRIHVNAGLGIFEWGRDDDRILLKRGMSDESNNLVWVGLDDDSFTLALHGLEFHSFQIAPDGNFLAVTIPGKRVLKLYSLE